MASSLSNLVNNLSEGHHRIKCKLGHDDKKCETYGIRYKYFHCFIKNTKFKDDLPEYNSLVCNKNFQTNFDKKLKKQFSNTNKIYNRGYNKFILLLRKGVHPYEYMDDWKKTH